MIFKYKINNQTLQKVHIRLTRDNIERIEVVQNETKETKTAIINRLLSHSLDLLFDEY